MTPTQKVEVATRLAAMGVDVLETGFPAASKTDFEATTRIAQQFSDSGPVVAAFSVLKEEMLAPTWEAVKWARSRRIQLSIGTSDIHIVQKLGKTREQILAKVRAMIGLAAVYDWEIQFLAEDATRSEPRFLWEVLAVAVEAGARFLEISDTVGFCIPAGYGELIAGIRKEVRGIEGALIGTHAHNDFGLALANTLAGLQAGARQAGCSMNGLGERTGNADTGTLALVLREHPEIGFATGVSPDRLFPTARFIAEATGIPIPANHPLVGRNAFRTGTGLHQNGFLKDLARNPRPERFSYSAFDPQPYGLEFSFIYNYLSGAKGLAHRLRELGYPELDEAARKRFAVEFLKVANLEENLKREDLPEEVFHEIAARLGLPRSG